MDQQMSSWLGYWLKRSYRNICNFLDNRLAEYDLTNSQLGVLLLLWETDGLTQTQIQQVLGIQPASLTHLIKGLENKSLITRKTDSIDSRVKRIYLTPKSKELEQACLSIALEGEEMARQGFSPEEINVLISWLKKINNNLDI